jgi:hypothetical protein
LNPSRARASVVGAFGLLCAYFTGFFPPFSNPNELSRLQTVVAFVETGSFAIDGELATLGEHEDKAASGGHFYSNKAPGLALAAIPVYRLLRFFLPRPDSPTAPIFVLLRLFTVSLVCVVALARFGRRLSLKPERASVAPLVTFGVGFGTPFLYYARSFFGHAWTASLLFLAWDALREEVGDATPARRRELSAVLAGLLAGWAAISEYTVAPVALALAVRAAAPSSGKGRKGRLLAFFAGSAIPLGLLLGYQALCFGSPFVPSYAREAYPAYAALAHRRFLGFGVPSARVALDYLFHPARGILLFSPFFLWAGPGFARWLRSKRERVDGVFALAAPIVSFLLLTGYPNWHGGWSLGSRYLLPLVFLVAAALPFALGTSLSRGLFAAAVAFSAGSHVLATLSWPNFPLDLSFPPASGSAWFLTRGWVAPNAGGALGLAPAFSISIAVGASALALFFATSAARPLTPNAPAATLVGLALLAVMLVRPPGLSYPARLLRAAIFGDYSGLDPNHEELRKVVNAASTPLERRQAARAWETVINRSRFQVPGSR